MRVLIVTQYFHPERFVINEIAADLTGLGHQVTVLTGVPNYPGGRFFEGYGHPWPRREMVGDVEVVRVPILPRGSGSGLRLFLNYASYVLSACLFGPFLLRGKPFDAVFVFEISPVTVGLPAILMKKLKRARLFFWVLDLWPESLAATGAVKSPWILDMVRRLVRFIYRRSDVILVQSRAFTGKVREVLPEARDIRYFPNPADRQFRPVSLPASAPERALLRPGFQIMYGGNFGAAQGFETILSAAERLADAPEVQWVLIGDGRMRSWVEDEIRTRKLESVVQVLGPYPPERMPAFFALADVLLVTLRNEEIFSLTVPQKLIAYLACGRPILAAIEGEAARVVDEARAGLTVPASNADALAAAARRLYEMPAQELERMGQSGRLYFEREFDRDMLMQRLDDWLREPAAPGTRETR